jgi:hypothetical protein
MNLGTNPPSKEDSLRKIIFLMISYLEHGKIAAKHSHPAKAIQKELWTEWLACFP